MRERHIIRSYDDLLAGLAKKRAERGMTTLELDDASGLQDGYTAKLENHFLANGKKSTRAIGPVTLSLWLQALGVGLVIVDDARKHRASAHVLDKNDYRKTRQAGGAARFAKMDKAALKKFTSSGARMLNKRLGKDKRSANARKAARARWGKLIPGPADPSLV